MLKNRVYTTGRAYAMPKLLIDNRTFCTQNRKIMEDNVALVFHGFLNLTGLEKLKLTEEINKYFDAIDRDPIRIENDEIFAKLELGAKGCKCCGGKKKGGF